MASTTLNSNLRNLLIQQLRLLGIPASIGFKQLGNTKMVRVYVVSNKFKALRYSERQSLVWRIVEREIPQDQQDRISMIITVTEAELQDDDEAPNIESARPRRRG